MVTDSPEMNALRDRNRLRRYAWVDKNRQHNRDEQNWRRGVNSVENVHPYAWNHLPLSVSDGIMHPVSNDESTGDVNI